MRLPGFLWRNSANHAGAIRKGFSNVESTLLAVKVDISRKQRTFRSYRYNTDTSG